ncbi:hypothetical protein ACFX13_046806 [Malus domestica]
MILVNLTQEKDVYLDYLAMTKKTTCDNSTLEARPKLDQGMVECARKKLKQEPTAPLFLFTFYIPICNDGDEVLGIIIILKLRNQLVSHQGNNIRSNDPHSVCVNERDIEGGK